MYVEVQKVLCRIIFKVKLFSLYIFTILELYWGK